MSWDTPLLVGCFLLVIASPCCVADLSNTSDKNDNGEVSLSTYCNEGFRIKQYDEESQQCIVPLEGYCGTLRPLGPWSFDRNKFRCGNNAICSNRSNLCQCSDSFLQSNDKVNCVCPLNSSPKVNHVGYSFTIACECNEGYLRITDGKGCAASKELGQSCDDPKVLSLCEYPTTCENGVCVCESNFREEESACRLRAAYGCNRETFYQCTANSECIKGQCICDEGYAGTEDGACKVKFGSPCQLDGDCAGDLACTDGICGCRNPLNQISREVASSCRNLVGVKCDANETSSCVQNAYCNPLNGTCECLGGFARTRQNLCARIPLAHGETCRPSDCDFRKGMACINQKCTCYDSALNFYGDDIGCLAPLGSKCGRYTTGILCDEGIFDCAYNITCEKDLVCKKGEHGEEICEPGNELSVAELNSSAPPSKPVE